MTEKEQMNVVIVGHVDHGKSTLIGRLLADTDSLPHGKLEAVRANCERNAKPFEYAFLLDALKDEQSQGITIDTARCFFKSAKRDYIIIDAPGHIEFLKNMVTGAARAEAAILVIDADEGIKENSKRHGYMLSFLGIKNITICVNKMDLVDYKEEVFENIKAEYAAFLKEINLKPKSFIPVSAREGDNIVTLSKKMTWYRGQSALEALDHFEKAAPTYSQDFRFPLQDIYKFTEAGDDRRIFAGRIETGRVKIGDEVVFLPSQKTSKITHVEGFNVDTKGEAVAGQSTGFSLETQVYVRPGEILSKVSEKKPHVSHKFKVNIFWMGRQPLVKNKNYKLKITTQHVPVRLSEIVHVLDASELSSVTNKSQVDRHDVAECILETLKPVAFDEIGNISATGRFVIVDNYEICGGGIILAPVFDETTSLTEHIQKRDVSWLRSEITPDKRAGRLKHKSAFVVITGKVDTGKQRIARALEEELYKQDKYCYFLGLSNELLTSGVTTNDKTLSKVEHIQKLGDLAHILTDAGLILITSITDIDDYDLDTLKTLNFPNKTIVVNVGDNRFSAEKVDLILSENEKTGPATAKIVEVLSKSVVLDPEYTI